VVITNKTGRMNRFFCLFYDFGFAKIILKNKGDKK